VAFAFRQGEPVDVGARRLAREGSELVLSAMNRANADVGVHEARRTLKRLRALVRLIGPSIGERAKEANNQLRAAARDFAGTRDAAVILETFDRIAGDDEHARAMRKLLKRARRAAPRNDDDAVAQIRAFAASIDDWQFDGAWSSIDPGVRRTYRKGRKALEDATSGKSELHELRKRGKDLQFQLTLLRAAFPPVIGGYLDALRELGAVLGDEHDLWVLGETLTKKKSNTGRWAPLIEGKRAELRERALPLAAKIYVDTPRNWTDRLGVWFQPVISMRGD
jgi:CHAD domain-containing protein